MAGRKSEQLNLQATMLAERMKKIQEKALEKQKALESKEKDHTPDNDGQFMDKFLKSKSLSSSEKNNSGFQKRSLLKKGNEPAIKKSRFANMLQQMKRTNPKQANNSLVDSEIQSVTATCFHGDDSSSSDDETGNTSTKKTKKSTSVNNISNQQKSGSIVSNTVQSSVAAPSVKKPAAIISPTVVNPVGTIVSTPVSNTNVKSTPGNTKAKPRKKRWGDKVDLTDIAPPGMASIPGMQNPTPVVVQQPVSLGLPQNYRPVGLVGVTELSTAQKKQLEEQREMQNMYNLVMASRNAAVQNAAPVQVKQPKIKHAYDSDEEIDAELGTWEHQLRKKEMEKTQVLADKLTEEADGKHFIGDFLPPAELEKFMETYKALKEGRTPDFSDYKEFKIQCDNIGFKMLAKMGWEEGQGLGSEGQGITQPVNKGQQSVNGQGVGIERPDGLNQNDDDFSAYRKRMMLAYRFRPNPLNNPRRSYY
uniref:SURP and G-patch domain-containing protein 1 n=1 Tax=Ciona intestinalis TaxID=7719 RepID=UPI000180BA45|nr:SURP and G-patch domain-containing protein 1 [Ciona intestinalis]|eukprot:XP_002125786.1 SURP and G-patch domain-containing protein 1 [Ciona intestinalis]